MALVGDAIMTVRSAIPDPPSTLNPPTNLTATPMGGGTLGAFGTVYLVATATNPWGETTASSEISVAMGGSATSIVGSVTLPIGATGGRIYYSVAGGAPGSEQQWFAVGVNGTFTILAPGTAGYPPTQNSAFNPDTDGSYVSCALIYKWLNDGLTYVAGAAGGIEDTTGVASVAQQLYFQIPGRWIRFNTARWDQWPVVMGQRDYIQYRYNVSGVVSIIATEAMSAILGPVFSAFPEPARSSNTTTLTVAMGTTDNQLSCVDASSFTPMSRIQIDNEIMMFSQVNQTGQPGFANGLIRGVAGTTPAVHAIGATVTELKFNFSGFRYPQLYSPGQSQLRLDARHEWEVAAQWYMLARAKEKEQAMQEADALDQKFDAYCQRLHQDQANPIATAQIGSTLDRGRDVGRGRIIVN